jgi:hypothetical protein
VVPENRVLGSLRQAISDASKSHALQARRFEKPRSIYKKDNRHHWKQSYIRCAFRFPRHGDAVPEGTSHKP